MGIVFCIIGLFTAISFYCYCNCADQAEMDECQKMIEQARKEWRERRPIWRPITIMTEKQTALDAGEKETEWKL